VLAVLLSQLGYISDDIKIFKMAAARRLEFSKFAILVTWPVSELDSAS